MLLRGTASIGLAYAAHLIVGQDALAAPLQDDLSPLLEPIRQQYNLPGLAAAFARDGELTAIGAAGVRKRGAAEPMLKTDIFHIGSNTKSMTATLLAGLVEDGTLSWQTTIAETFPELRSVILPEYHSVNLISLLSHRAGIEDRPRYQAIAWRLTGPLPEQRLTMLRTVLAESPADPPDSAYRYSNHSYVIAGAIAERWTGQSWEDLMQARMFTPLNLLLAGFGAPGNPNLVDQPWGHQQPESEPVAPGPEADNPAVLGPAGTVHCSLADAVNYGILHARGARGESGLLLSPERFQDLHRDWYTQGYALGWLVTDREWAGGRALVHTGSNTYWFHDIWVAPTRNAVLVSATNAGYGGEACDAAIAAMISQYLS